MHTSCVRRVTRAERSTHLADALHARQDVLRAAGEHAEVRRRLSLSSLMRGSAEHQ